MTAQEVIDAIHARQSTGFKSSLQLTQKLMAEMQLNTKLTVPVIHVAGTNGKGSTCAMLMSVLEKAGYHTGCYTSPFLQSYHERIRIGGIPIDDELLASVGTRVLAAAEHLEQVYSVHYMPFELGTVLAIAAFHEAHCDAIILETGMGGRLDATTAIEPDLCIITRIGMDHMDYLGNTLGAIAGEKAGILCPGIPLVLNAMPKEASDVILARACALNVPVQRSDDWIPRKVEVFEKSLRVCVSIRNDWDVSVNLAGKHQVENILGVLCAVETLRDMGLRIPSSAVQDGLRELHWPGRLEWHGNILMDSAHNEDGLKTLAAYWNQTCGGKNAVLLTGMMTDKVTDKVLYELSKLSETIVTVCPAEHRGMSAETLATRLKDLSGHFVYSSSSVEEGLRLACQLADEQQACVIVSGSMYLVGAVRTLLGLSWRGE